MTTSKKSTNGRSPLVNQQRQITAFFGKKMGASPCPSPSPLGEPVDKIPNSSGSASPVTPSPLQSKRNKPLLGSNLRSSSIEKPSSSCNEYGSEVVDRKIRVYWPLDKSWYGGYVKSFDKLSRKHSVKYDDDEEEMLNLSQEKIEWVEETTKKRRRLRKFCLLENEDGEEVCKELEDNSGDEDWVEKDEKEDVEDEEDEDFIKELDFEEETASEKGCDTIKRKSRKRSVTEGELVASIASKKRDISLQKINKVSEPSVVVLEKPIDLPEKITNNGGTFVLDSQIPGDDSKRFIDCEEKFRFLNVDRKDASGRRPGDENYDPRTLHLPKDFVKNLTGGQRQWWDFKSKHMDKVLFFKMGKFYELYEMDAHVGARELGLQYMKGDQPHCGFPEKNFSINVDKLARKGYRILVVEQTETPEQLELRRRESGSKDKVVKREVCAVITKGTMTDGELISANPDASYLMALCESCQISASQPGCHTFGVCVVDVSTSKIVLGQFQDDADCSSLCSLLSELRPVEIIKPAKLLCPETEKALFRHTRSPLVNELIPLSEFWNAEKTISEVTKFYESSALTGDDTKCIPDALSKLANLGEDGCEALSALGGALFYLRQALLDETILKFATFDLLPSSGFRVIAEKPYMVLDAAALENLEIFDSANGDTSGTLYAQLNHCTTAFGKRLLRKWLARPLHHLNSIKERQDAIAALKVNSHVLDFRKELSKLPDLERLLARVFASSDGNGRNACKVVLYEDAAKKQLQEFITVLRGCELITHACASFAANSEIMESRLLHHLLPPGAGLPDVCSILRHFKDAFDWDEANQSGRIIPREGADVEYDAACQKLKDVDYDLRQHLKEQMQILGDSSISFVTIGKDTYLLEVPESLSQRVPREYELRSSRKGFFRYWTPKIRELIGELSRLQSDKDSKLKSILLRLIEKFCENHRKWRQMVATVAELDVLISLSVASEYYEGKTCRPVISAQGPRDVPNLCARSLGHPILKSDNLREGTFVINDVTLGGSGHASFMLLTGPNMGGKSTLLRQVCLAVILAQIGADVPAESFVLSPVDRIFVRMGAKDQIMASQSTFLTELLETASMLNAATRHSLVALDELGRGTSTSDGQAIAAAVLEHLLVNVQCLGMFSTHYHRLANDYQKDPKVSLWHMACQVGEGTAGLEEVIFLYKLMPGACPKSYGINVARLAGLPNTVLTRAVGKSQEFESGYGKALAGSACAQSLDTLIIKEVIKFASTSCHRPLTDLQSRVRLLLQQQ